MPVRRTGAAERGLDLPPELVGALPAPPAACLLVLAVFGLAGRRPGMWARVDDPKLYIAWLGLVLTL